MHSLGVGQDLREIYKQVFKFPLSVHRLFIQFPTSLQPLLKYHSPFFFDSFIFKNLNVSALFLDLI